MKHLGLFEGIGGFSLAARWMGWETIAWCEWNEFGQKVLKHHFPEAEGHGDITKTDFTKYANRVDILTGGFPCQPYSIAGEQLGASDSRHLFPEMLRTIREVRPRWVVAENVYGIVTAKFKGVLEEIYTSLETEGYSIQSVVIPASAVNAPHERERVWIIAHASGKRTDQHQPGIIPHINRNDTSEIQGGKQQGGVRDISESGDAADTINEGSQGNERPGKDERENRERAEGAHGATSELCWRDDWAEWPTQSPLCNGDDGLSSRLDLSSISFPKWRNESIKAGGNAIVPQVAFEIFKAIEQYELFISNDKS